VKLLGQFFDSLEFLIEILGQYSLSRLVHVGWDGLCEACQSSASCLSLATSALCVCWIGGGARFSNWALGHPEFPGSVGRHNVWCAGNLGRRDLKLLQRICGLWRLCCAIVFCKCFRDYFRLAAFARLFDDADYVLIAHPHGAVRIVFYAVSV
jgi:hypothetical protein